MSAQLHTLLIVDVNGNPSNYTDTAANLAAIIATALALATPPQRIEYKN